MRLDAIIGVCTLAALLTNSTNSSTISTHVAEQTKLLEHTRCIELEEPRTKQELPPQISTANKPFTMAMYDENTNTIHYNKEYIKQVEMYNEHEHLAVTTRHELGHHYANQHAKQHGVGAWPSIKEPLPKSDEAHRTSLVQAQARKIISEGVAEYIANNQSPKEVDWNSVEHPNHEEIYRGGHALVKPILEAYGKRGLRHLQEIPPSITHLGELEAYQQQILTKLAQTGPSSKDYTECHKEDF